MKNRTPFRKSETLITNVCASTERWKYSTQKNLYTRVIVSSNNLITFALVLSHVKTNLDGCVCFFWFFFFALHKLEHVNALISYTCCQKSSQLFLHSRQFISTSDSGERSLEMPSYLNRALRNPCWLIFAYAAPITTERPCFRLVSGFTNMCEQICVNVIMWPFAVLLRLNDQS